MAKRKTKTSPRRKRAARAAAPAAPSVEVNPAAPVRRLGDAMLPDLRKARMITTAMDASRSRSRGGPPSGVWKLGVPTLFQVACRSIIDGETSASIIKSIDAQISAKQIGERAVYRWLETVRDHYWHMLYAAVEKQAKDIKFDETLNDPESATEMLMALLATRTQEMLTSNSFAEASTGERHLIVRAYRECVKTLESLAKNRTSRAQSEKIISTIRAAADACDRGGVRIGEGRAGAMLRELLEGKMPKELGGNSGGRKS